MFLITTQRLGRTLTNVSQRNSTTDNLHVQDELTVKMQIDHLVYEVQMRNNMSSDISAGQLNSTMPESSTRYTYPCHSNSNSANTDSLPNSTLYGSFGNIKLMTKKVECN